MKRWLLAATFGVVALGLMLYPLVGEILSEKYHSDIETAYTAAIEDTDDVELTAQREAAEQYNAMLSGTSLCDQTCLSHLLCKKCLTKTVVDFMSTCVV